MQNFIKAKFYLPILIFIFTNSHDAKSELSVVTSIKPIHSITSNILDGISEPILLVEGTTSPHSYILKPSHVEAINNADVIFFVSNDLETFLERPLNNVKNSAKIIELIDNEDLFVLNFRENNIYLGKDHDDHEDHAKHDDHDDHAKHDDHDEHDDHGHHEHAQGEFDVHIWLDPFNAKVIANNIAEELSKLDPENISRYQNNRDKFVERVSDTEKKISQQLDHYVSYVTFHDGYQYFENRFDVLSSGSLTINPDSMPGARELSDVRELMVDNDIHCIFSEPQFNPKVVEVIADDTNTKMGILDPVGTTIPLGKDHYFGVLTAIADSLEDCGHDH